MRGLDEASIVPLRPSQRLFDLAPLADVAHDHQHLALEQGQESGLVMLWHFAARDRVLGGHQRPRAPDLLEGASDRSSDTLLGDVLDALADQLGRRKVEVLRPAGLALEDRSVRLEA